MGDEQIIHLGQSVGEGGCEQQDHRQWAQRRHGGGRGRSLFTSGGQTRDPHVGADWRKVAWLSVVLTSKVMSCVILLGL